MAERLRIFPILKTQLQFDVSPPIFESLATQVLGNAATDSDGFHADLLAVADQLQSDTNLVTAGDADLAAADFKAGEFAAGNIDPLVQQTGVFNSSGDSLLQELDDSSGLPGSVSPAPDCGTALTAQDGYKQTRCPLETASFARHYGGFPKGDCTFTTKVDIFEGEAVHAPQAIRVVSADAAFKKLELIFYSPGPPPGKFGYVQATVSAANAGNFHAQIEVTWPDYRGKQLANLCIDIVELSSTSNAQASAVLPIGG